MPRIGYVINTLATVVASAWVHFSLFACCYPHLVKGPHSSKQQGAAMWQGICIHTSPSPPWEATPLATATWVCSVAACASLFLAQRYFVARLHHTVALPYSSYSRSQQSKDLSSIPRDRAKYLERFTLHQSSLHQHYASWMCDDDTPMARSLRNGRNRVDNEQCVGLIPECISIMLRKWSCFLGTL